MPHTSDVTPISSPIFLDEHIIIVNKPSGLLCVPGLSEPENLHDTLKKNYPNARVVHRLDMATSGLIIFALHYEAQKAMGKLFEKREIKKTYSALVHGILKDDCGEIHAPILCDWPNRPKQKIDWLNGKMGSTFFQVEKRYLEENQTHVKLHPHTGRTHQLRIHMQLLGHPILGDNFYANDEAKEKTTRLCLHAEQLNFIHPITKEDLNITLMPGFI